MQSIWSRSVANEEVFVPAVPPGHPAGRSRASCAHGIRAYPREISLSSLADIQNVSNPEFRTILIIAKRSATIGYYLILSSLVNSE